MNYVKISSYLTLAGAIFATAVLPACSEVVETTTVETTTRSTELVPVVTTPGVVTRRVITPGSTSTVVTTAPLASTRVRTYAVVDPITGIVKDYYDPVVKRTVNGVVLQSGLIVVDNSSGKLIGGVDSYGNIVDLNVAPAIDSLVVSIDTRRRDLELSLDAALSQGKITATQAQELRAELEKIAAQEAAARASGHVLSVEQAFLLANSLDVLQTRFVPIVKTVVMQPPVIAPQFITIAGQTVFADNITYRKTKMEQRINDEYAAGRLSAQQVADLKTRLNAISSDQTKYRKNGELSQSRERALNIRLDKTQTAMEKDIALINQRRSRIGIRVD